MSEVPENADKELRKLTERLRKEGRTPRLFLHSCCGPCSSYVLEYLSPYFEICVFYYNLNMDTDEEYVRRRDEQIRLINESRYPNPVTFIAGDDGADVLPDYGHAVYLESVKGHENDPEGGDRCALCFELRLRMTARKAREKGYDYFATTLSVSPHKNARLINETGRRIEKEEGAAYLPTDFKKQGGYLRSVELAKEHGLYRQNYCGCEFAKSHLEEA